MPTFPFPESAVILTQTVTGQDAYGNDVYTPTEVQVTGAFAPGGTTELIQGEDVVISNPTFYLSDGEPVPAATDSMRIRGVVYLVDGKPRVYHNPFTGEEPGAVVQLENVT
jgi:hypothetical protein